MLGTTAMLDVVGPSPDYVGSAASGVGLSAVAASALAPATLGTGCTPGRTIPVTGLFRRVAPSAARLRNILGLTDTEAKLLPNLSRAQALWKVGTRSFLVVLRLSAASRTSPLDRPEPVVPGIGSERPKSTWSKRTSVRVGAGHAAGVESGWRCGLFTRTSRARMCQLAGRLGVV